MNNAGTRLLIFTAEAEQDLKSIRDYIRIKANQKTALIWIEKLRNECEIVRLQPEIGILKEKYGRNVRRVTFKKYLIFYYVSKEKVFIIKITHGARDVDRLFAQ